MGWLGRTREGWFPECAVVSTRGLGVFDADHDPTPDRWVGLPERYPVTRLPQTVRRKDGPAQSATPPDTTPPVQHHIPDTVAPTPATETAESTPTLGVTIPWPWTAAPGGLGAQPGLPHGDVVHVPAVLLWPHPTEA